MFIAGTYGAAWCTQNITNSSTIPQSLVQCCDNTHDKWVTGSLFDFFSWHCNYQIFLCWNNIIDITVLSHAYSHNVAFLYEGCPESIRPLLIPREPVAWPWCDLATSQRRPYCASVNSHSPVGGSHSAVRCYWLTLCTVWLSHSQWQSELISFITTMCLPIL